MNESIVSIKGLVRRFGGVTAVNNLEFTVYKGEILGIIGPNGAGKSTTFDLLTGLQKPDAGQIIFDNNNVTGFKPHVLNQLGIGRTFQKIQVFSGLSVLENTMIGAFARLNNVHAAMKKAEDVLTFVGLIEQGKKLASSLTLVDRKKLELARALCTNPKLLLIDELMCGLNQQETIEGVKLLQRINSMGMTVVLVEHVMDVILSLTHRVVVLNYGEKIAEGLPEDIVRNQQVIEAYLGGGLEAC